MVRSRRVAPPRESSSRLGPLHRLAVALVLLAVAVAVGRGTVSYAQSSDPFGTLLTSKAIAFHGTLRLDALGLDHLDARLGYRMFDRGGHQYYVYPVGTPLLAAPFVALAHGLGYDVADYGTEVRVQHWLVVACAILTAWLLVRLAHRLLPFWPALVCASVFWAGTSLASAGGAALWSHNLAAVFALVAIDLVVAAEVASRRVAWLPVGIVLFLGYLVRPTMALFAVTVLAWAAIRDGRGAIKAGVVVTVGLAGFMAFSWREFGELLPPYYQMGLQGGAFSIEALAGLLVSPSRGLLVFSPMLLAVWAARPLAATAWPLSRGWWLVGIAWPVGLVLALSRWGMWWGGGCYGPRLLTDALPGLFLLTLRAWPVRRPHGWLTAAVVVLAMVSAFSAWVHTWQGLHNPWTIRWNMEPSVDTEPWSRFNWWFPQLLHDMERHRARMVAYFARHEPTRRLPPLRSGDTLAPDAPQFDPLGFDRMRAEGRWTLLHVAELLFAVEEQSGPIGELVLTYGTNGRQVLRVQLNEATLFEGAVDTRLATLSLPVPAGTVAPGVNRLRVMVEEPRHMRRGDPNVYGIVVKQVGFR